MHYLHSFCKIRLLVSSHRSLIWCFKHVWWLFDPDETEEEDSPSILVSILPHEISCGAIWFSLFKSVWLFSLLCFGISTRAISVLTLTQPIGESIKFNNLELLNVQLAWLFIILQNDNIMISWDFLRLRAPAAMPGHLGAVSLKKSHDIVILSFCNIVKGQAN